jgi:hypothetical protein
MPDIEVDKEAQQIWDDLAAKEAKAASGEADPPSVETTEATKEGDGNTDTTTVTTTEAPAEPADADKTKTADGNEPPAEPDIWADAKPEQKAAYEAAIRERDERVAHAKRVGSTVAGYQRQVDSLKRELEAARKGAPSGNDTTTGKTSAGIFDDPELKKFSEEYPEVAGPLRKVFSALEQRAEKAERELGAISTERRDANLEEQANIVYEAHPDYDKIARTPEFREWFEQAPPYIQEGVRRNAEQVVDGREVAHIVKLYKLENGIAASTARSDPAPGSPKPSQSSRRAHQLQSASTPAPKGPARVQDGPPDDPEAAWAWWARKDAEVAQTR